MVFSNPIDLVIFPVLSEVVFKLVLELWLVANAIVVPLHECEKHCKNRRLLWLPEEILEVHEVAL